MKAIVLSAYGGADNFDLADLPIPEIRRGEVRIKVHTLPARLGSPADGEYASYLADRVPAQLASSPPTIDLLIATPCRRENLHPSFGDFNGFATALVS